MYLRTGSVVSSQLGEPGISVKFDFLGVGVRQNKPVWSPPAGREQGAVGRRMPLSGKWDVTVSAEAKKLSVTALVQMRRQKSLSIKSKTSYLPSWMVFD